MLSLLFAVRWHESCRHIAKMMPGCGENDVIIACCRDNVLG
jgi:hypothetical protein